MGLVFKCDKSGKIIKILENNFFDSIKLKEFDNWLDFIDQENRVKGEFFVKEIIETGFAVNWEINISASGKIESCHFVGIKENRFILVFIVRNIGELDPLLDRFMISNRMKKQLSFVKEIIQLKNTDDNRYLNEISSLNNELINLQRQLTKSNIELEKLNIQKNRFLGMAAHDLRNPLSNILNLSELLMETSGKLNKEQIQFLKYIHDRSQFMIQLVEDLLNITTIESGTIELKRKLVDVTEMTEKNIELNRMLAAKKSMELIFSSTLKPTSQIAEVDSRKIEQVLNNLIFNAIKYSKPGNDIYIKLEEKDDTIIFSVVDQGLGIKEEEMDLLFKAFRKTTNEATGGEGSTGLGLYISKRIVEAHGGQIKAESVYGKGSVFSFSLPKYKGNKKSE